MDPNIPTDKQLNMKYSYQGNYDRGHMLPSASRVRSNDDNRQTFYPTNMTPQLDMLNQKKWAEIEIMVRDWAEGCDTLYVVTGAVMQTVGGNETVSYTYCKSDSNKDVAIPNYYYKALLQLQIRGGVKSYQALGLWVPHKAASGAPTKSDVKTIDQIEELTGLDFFHNLDDSTEQRVESSVDYLFWGGIKD
jgi:endonuclease G